MRPKVVIFILLSGVVAIILMAAIHGIMNKQDVQPPAPVSSSAPAELNTQPLEVVTNQGRPSTTNVVEVTTDEERAARKAADIDAIQDALVDADHSPASLMAISDRLGNPDKEVRKAALEAAVHFGDTNIIPRLNEVLQQTEDTREKAAILEAIAYLQQPTTVTIPSNGIAPPIQSPTVNRGVRGNSARQPKGGPVAPGQSPTVPGPQ